MDERRSGWLTVAACAAVFVIAHWLPAPGIDQAQLAELTGDPLGMPFVGVLPGLVQWLVVVRALRALAERRAKPIARADRIAAGIWIALSIPGALFFAQYLEHASDDGWSTGLIGVVREPGLVFRAGVVLARAAGAALVWALAERIRRTERASGTLVLASVESALGMLSTIVRAAADATVGAIVAISVALAAATIALAALALVVARRPPPSWPRPALLGLPLRSSLDVGASAMLVGGWVAGMTASAATYGIVPGLGPESALARAAIPSLAWTTVGDGSVLAIVLDGAAIGLAALAIALAWSARVPIGSARSVSAATVPAASLVLTVCALVAWRVTGGAERALAPAPWAGSEDLEIVAICDRAVATHDAEIVRSRIEIAGMDGTVAALDARRLRIVLRGVAGPEIARALLVPRRFGLHLVEDELDDSLPGYTPRQISAAARVLGSEAELRALPAPSPGLARAIECGEEQRCTAWTIDATAEIANDDVADAAVSIDPDSQAPYVSLVLTSEGAAVFEDVTAEHVHQQLAIVVDGRALSVPTIQSPIRGGHVQITLGEIEDYDEALEDAQALAEALSVGAALEGDWAIESISAPDRPGPPTDRGH